MSLAALLAVVWSTVAHAQSATYQVTFTGQWTTTATLGGVPSRAHFSPLIGAVHNAQVAFWSSGGTASAGDREYGRSEGTSTLKSEITAVGSNVGSSGTSGATVTATVTTLGQEFLRGAEGECVGDDFPGMDQTVTLE